ncbi:DNA mismatch endonuclease Vsr [Bradyrhizobium sp. IC3195]|uniref:very short patch repair endonuclease n=1 Tax=Bradyrhizobium sp. IC3195 TaxID=2793804 RepID=UPI001CD405CE|nr:DNA mismatch endonuclease Vsr [Bradyrhizobium sp. IC3195]MCA1469632.1 DNA mismatch endonuclease Vsr [Bradyrhizobium sp. IC3195]
MADILDAKRRSALMSRVGPRNSKPERAVRSCLHRLGFRFRLHRSDLPGTPDIVLPKHSAVLFVHGCFWHRHLGCKKSTMPSTRRSFWISKFEANVARDRRVKRKLRSKGWSVLTVWECQTKKQEVLTRLLTRRLGRLTSSKAGR